MPATIAEIATAAAKLQEANRLVSVRSIREVLGGGSPNVLASLLRQWRQTQLQFPDTVAAPPQMVAEVASVAPRLWTLALEEARTHVQGDIDRLTVALRDANAATDEIQSLFDESVGMRAQCEEERKRAIAAAEAMEVRCAALDAHCAHQVALMTEAQSALKRQQEASEQLASKWSLSETTREHENAKLRAEISARDQKISDQRAALAEKESSLSAANASIARLTSEVQRLTNLSSASHQQVTDLELQLAVERVAHQEQLTSREREALALRTQKEILVSQIGMMQISMEYMEKESLERKQAHLALTDHLAALEPIHRRLSEIERLMSRPSPPEEDGKNPQ